MRWGRTALALALGLCLSACGGVQDLLPQAATHRPDIRCIKLLEQGFNTGSAPRLWSCLDQRAQRSALKRGWQGEADLQQALKVWHGENPHGVVEYAGDPVRSDPGTDGPWTYYLYAPDGRHGLGRPNGEAIEIHIDTDGRIALIQFESDLGGIHA